MVSPRVSIQCKPIPSSPLYTIGNINREGKRSRMAPLRDHLPHLLCFESAHEASEVCRVANFCTKSVDMIDMTSYPVDEYCCMLVTSHDELAAEGWRQYGTHMCVLDKNVWKVKVVSTCVHHHESFRWDVKSGLPFTM